PRVAELDLRLRILPHAAEPDDGAFTELGVAHALPYAIVQVAHRHAAGHAARRAGSGRAGRRASIGVGPAPSRLAPALGGQGPGFARGQPFEVLFGNLVQKARTHRIARLAVQHAALGEGKVEPLAGARDGHVHEAAFFFEARSVK